MMKRGRSTNEGVRFAAIFMLIRMNFIEEVLVLQVPLAAFEPQDEIQKSRRQRAGRLVTASSM